MAVHSRIVYKLIISFYESHITPCTFHFVKGDFFLQAVEPQLVKSLVCLELLLDLREVIIKTCRLIFFKLSENDPSYHISVGRLQFNLSTFDVLITLSRD